MPGEYNRGIAGPPVKGVLPCWKHRRRLPRAICGIVTENEYPAFHKTAEDEGETAAALAFSHARDAEGCHAKLYERAILNVIKDVVKAYHVCQVCGYVTDKKIPDTCPVCGAPPEKFKTIEA